MARFLILCCTLLLLACSDPGDPQASSPQARNPGAETEASLAQEQASHAPASARPSTARRKIVIAADPWCPHNCRAGSEHEGYMIDITREAFALAGIDVEYVNMSWARAVQLTREGHMEAVVGALPGDAPDFVFPDTAIGHTTIALFTHPDSDWQYRGVESLAGITLLAINGYAYSPELDAYIDRNQDDQQRVWILSGPAPLGRAIELLRKRRSDVFPEDRYVMAWEQARSGENRALRMAAVLHESPLYVAFSPNRQDSVQLAARLSNGTRALEASGRVDQILSRYGLSRSD